MTLLMKERAQDRQTIQRLENQLEKHDQQLKVISNDYPQLIKGLQDHFENSTRNITKKLKEVIENQIEKSFQKVSDLKKDQDILLKKMEDQGNQIKKQSNKAQQLEKRKY